MSLPQYDLDSNEIVETEDYDDVFEDFADVKIGYSDEGEEFYIKDEEGVVSANIGAYIVLDEIGVNRPDMGYDREKDRVIFEDVGGKPPERMSDQELERIDFDEDTYLDSLASKLLVGDWDTEFNLLSDEYGEFTPIDYDWSCSDPINENVVDILQVANPKVGELIGIQLSEDQLIDRINELSSNADIERVEERLEAEPRLDNYEDKNQILENLSYGREL